MHVYVHAYHYNEFMVESMLSVLVRAFVCESLLTVIKKKHARTYDARVEWKTTIVMAGICVHARMRRTGFPFGSPETVCARVVCVFNRAYSA